ncbi:major capsid protein [Streptomyces sp. AMCC400023]|uniref:major capsid protein n=1 Tax=Streptomyces sp. AMCC400023 TaxID=2056258 RepID=UPI001F42ABE6|nr:major capsid protein [Streptomyces sp. AMCC400023]UJV42978.1 cell wall protein [Streptomyces sp. AMCC400023]
MTERFTIPEDFSALDDTQLADLLTQALAEFSAIRGQAQFSGDDMDQMRSLSSGARRIRDEQAARLATAEAAAAEIETLAAEFGTTPTAPQDEAVEEPEAEPVAAADPAGGEPTDPAGDDPAPAVTASARPVANLSQVRQRQPRVIPPSQALQPYLTASVDVPGYRAGTRMELADLTPGAINRANQLAAQRGGVGIVASYHHPFPDELIVNDPGSAPEGTTVAMHAGSQARLSGQNLVASGGWCAPSETEYSFLQTACPDMLWDAPEIQLARGGLRYFKTPSLDVAELTWVHTEADDIAGNPKPCFKIPCEEPVEVRCDAIGICIQAGILTQRHFPELVSFYLRQALVAHEIRVRQVLLNAVALSATPVAIAATWGALSPVFAAVALQAADMIERHSLCDSIALEVVFPWWSRNLFLADIARRNGVAVDEVTTADVQAVFSPLGVRIQWARGITNTLPLGNPPVNNGIGGPTPALVWPDEIQFLIYPAGQLQIGRGAEVNLGVIHDSVQFATNDYTAAFSEECTTLVDRSIDTRLVTVPVCPSGQSGAQTLLTCPAA